MASSRTEPFPLHGLVPYRGALYSITHQEVFSQGRHYRIGRYVGEHYDERVMIRHWVLLEQMEKLARFHVGDTALHPTWGPVQVHQRVWRFAVGAIVYHVAPANTPQPLRCCWQHELSALPA